MREILFRGKAKDCVCKKNGEWIYSSIIKSEGEKTQLFSDKMWVNIDAETLGQYTGCVDREGKKIFEGDLLHTVWGTLYAVRMLRGCWVAWNTKSDDCCEGWDALYSVAPKVFILGNIYDAKEMINND